MFSPGAEKLSSRDLFFFFFFFFLEQPWSVFLESRKQRLSGFISGAENRDCWCGFSGAENRGSLA